MEKNDLCFLVKDLCPIYEDKAVSEESKEIIRRHLESCADCRGYYNRLHTPLPPVNEKERCVTRYETLARRIRHRRWAAAGAVVLLMAAACIVTLLFLKPVSVSGSCMAPALEEGKNYWMGT